MSYVVNPVGTRWGSFNPLEYKVNLGSMTKDSLRVSATEANREHTNDSREMIRYTQNGTPCMIVGWKAIPDEKPGNYIDLRVL